MKYLVILISLLVLNPTSALCDGVECSSGEVKVCFADGECICQVRQIELTDPVPEVNECVDETDSGVCS